MISDRNIRLQAVVKKANKASVLLHLWNQETTESCVIIFSPNMTVCSKFHEHLVSLLQLQEHCVSSIISCVKIWPVVLDRDYLFIILEQVHFYRVCSSSMREDGKIVNTCNRCDEDTCGNNRVLVTFNLILLSITKTSNHKSSAFFSSLQPNKWIKKKKVYSIRSVRFVNLTQYIVLS